MRYESAGNVKFPWGKKRRWKFQKKLLKPSRSAMAVIATIVVMIVTGATLVYDAVGG